LQDVSQNIRRAERPKLHPQNGKWYCFGKTSRFLLAIQEKLACDIWLVPEKYCFFFAWRC